MAGERASSGQPINHFQSPHFLDAARYRIAVAKGEAMLLDPHKSVPILFDELVNRHSLSPFERVENLEPLGAADSASRRWFMGDIIDLRRLYTPRSLKGNI
jgi:hypothetical protein